ncbi:MAG: SpoIIE family protein phosphatase [Flavobacteriaceae bacterium]
MKDIVRWVLTLLICSPLFGQFEKQSDLKLSNQHVNDLIKTDQGLLWVATQEGLNLFYDDESDVFFSKIEDSLSVLNSDIVKLSQGFNNDLIAFTKDGLSIYNPKNFSFNQIPLKSAPTSLLVDPVEKKIWITTNQSGIYVLDEQLTIENHFEFDPLNPLSISTSKFGDFSNSKIHFDSISSKVFIATVNGLNVYDQKFKTFKRFFKGKKTGLTSNNVISIVPINEEKIGILSQNEFVVYQPKQNKFESALTFESPIESALSIDKNNSLLVTKSRSFLLNIDKDLKFLTQEITFKGQPILVDHKIVNENQLILWKTGATSLLKSNLSLSSISQHTTKDKINTVRVSKQDKGLMIATENGIERDSNKKNGVFNIQSFDQSLYFGVFEQQYVQVLKNSIIIGSYSDGELLQTFRRDFSMDFSNSKFEKIEGYLFFADETLRAFDLNQKRFVNPSIKSASISDQEINNIKAIGNYCYLSYENGIAEVPIQIFTKNNVELEKSIKLYEYNALLNKNLSQGFYDIEKIDTQFYVTDFNKGLLVFEENLGNFKKSYAYNGDSKKTLASSAPTKLFHDTNSNVLYIGTVGSGLFMLDLEEEIFMKKTVENGLLSNNIYDFSKIGDRLFIQTVSGINYLENGVIKNINAEDGLTINNFHKESIHPMGENVLFTGFDHYQALRLEDLEKDNQSFTIEVLKIVGLNKENQEFIVDLKEDNTIEIDYTTNTIILDLYSSSSYKTDQIQYFFNRNSSPKAISNGYNNQIQLSSFPYYNTQLEISAIDGNNHKSSNKLVFNVSNTPPWWLRTETIVFYVIFSIALVYTLVKLRETQTKKRMESERKSKELEEAKQHQNSLLPTNTPKIDGIQISTYLKSATEIGGDYYDFFYKKDEYFYAICGDATGHGVISGIMVSVTKAGLNGIPMGSPSKILQQLNRIVKRVNFGRLRMSLSVAKLNSDSIELSSAAMPPTYYFSAKKNSVEEILVPNLPLGGIETEQYDGVKIDFKEGDVMVMISDGLPELPNPKNELLDYEKVEQCIRNHCNRDADNIKDALVSLSEEWANGVMNPDDITIVVIKKAA